MWSNRFLFDRYLYEFLYGWLVSSLSRADSFIMEQEAAKEMEKATGRSSKKSKTKKKNRVRPYGREISMAQVLLNMCGGYYKVRGSCLNVEEFHLIFFYSPWLR